MEGEGEATMKREGLCQYATARNKVWPRVNGCLGKATSLHSLYLSPSTHVPCCLVLPLHCYYKLSIC